MKRNEVVPQRKIKKLTFYPIPKFNNAQLAFGAEQKSFFHRHDLPIVPEKYKTMASSYFFNGGALPEFHKSVDRKAAARALRAWLSSWAPAHEAKEATVAYALWLWTHETALNGEEFINEI